MGNIIGESLDDYVGEQIKKRQEIYGSSTRTVEEISYLNSRTAWVKLASGTSMDEERLTLLRPNNPMLDGVVPGLDLAQKNVLFNGLSYLEEANVQHEFNNPTDEEFAQGTAPSEKITGGYRLGSRQGINNIDRAYGVGGNDFCHFRVFLVIKIVHIPEAVFLLEGLQSHKEARVQSSTV